MPQGKGTYGSKRGRPKEYKKSNKGITGPYGEKLGKEGYAGEVKKQKERKSVSAKLKKLAKSVAAGAAAGGILRAVDARKRSENKY